MQGVKGDDGEDAEQIQFRTEGTWVQWKYESDTAWTNLYEIAIAPTIGERITLGLQTVGGVLPENALEYIEATTGTAVYLPTPTYAGHTFLGWFTETGTQAVANPYTMTESAYLYAKWHDGIIPEQIDAFDGIEYLISGISPYCTIAVNNQNCSEDAQLYVEYSFDKEYYKNGDTAVVTASFINERDAEKYVLSAVQSEYTVTNQAEYITSLDGVDTSALQAELADYITAKEGSAGWWSTGFAISFMDIVFDDGEYNNSESFEESDLGKFELKPQDTRYFASLKVNKRDDLSIDANIVSFIYRIEFRGVLTNHYICVMAENIVKNPDGSITWGSEKNTSSLDFTFSKAEGDMNNAITRLVMSKNIEYNISQISE